MRKNHGAGEGGTTPGKRIGGKRGMARAFFSLVRRRKKT